MNPHNPSAAQMGSELLLLGDYRSTVDAFAKPPCYRTNNYWTFDEKNSYQTTNNTKFRTHFFMVPLWDSVIINSDLKCFWNNVNSQQLWRRMATKVLCTVPRRFYLLTTSKDKSCVWFDWKSSPRGYCWTNGRTRSVGPFHGLDILFGTMAEQLFFLRSSLPNFALLFDVSCDVLTIPLSRNTALQTHREKPFQSNEHLDWSTHLAKEIATVQTLSIFKELVTRMSWNVPKNVCLHK